MTFGTLSSLPFPFNEQAKSGADCAPVFIAQIVEHAALFCGQCGAETALVVGHSLTFLATPSIILLFSRFVKNFLATLSNTSVIINTMSDRQSQFATWLQQELNRRDWKQSELCRRSGLSSATVSTVLSQQTKPGNTFCKGVACAFGIRDEEVFRHAGILDPLPPEVKEEREILLLTRALPPDTRRTAIAILRGLVDEYGPESGVDTPNYQN